MFWPILYSAVSFWGIALAGGLYWGRRYVRAIELQAHADSRILELESRVRSLESGISNQPALARGTAPSTNADPV